MKLFSKLSKSFPRLTAHHCKHQDLSFVRNIYGDQINQLNARSIWMCNDCMKTIYVNWLYDLGGYSDGYHTFNELYHHRALLFAVVCHNYKDLCWKSKKHHDGSMYDGMFIVGILTPNGQATYHYDIEPYWDLFNGITELEKAPIWDGHSPEDAINRIYSFVNQKPGWVVKDLRSKTERSDTHCLEDSEGLEELHQTLADARVCLRSMMSDDTTDK